MSIGVFGYVNAALIAFVASGAFHMTQLLSNVVVKERCVWTLLPSVVPLRPCVPCDVLIGGVTALALMNDSDEWWGRLPYLYAAQIASFAWSEAGFEWSCMILVLCFVPSCLDAFSVAWLLTSLLFMLRGRGETKATLSSLASSLYVCVYMLHRMRMPFAALVGTFAATEIVVHTLQHRLDGGTVKRYAGVPRAAHVAMELLLGVKCVDALDWHNFQWCTASVLPDELRGVQWRCGSVVVARRLYYSTRTEDGRVLLPLGYWNEVGFAPTLVGGACALLAALRPPLTIRAAVVRRPDGPAALVQEDVVCLLWVLPRRISDLFVHSIAPGSPCPTVEAVLLPSQMAMRRFTQVALILIFLRHFEWFPR